MRIVWIGLYSVACGAAGAFIALWVLMRKERRELKKTLEKIAF
jgi:hypothetical protein